MLGNSQFDESIVYKLIATKHLRYANLNIFALSMIVGISIKKYSLLLIVEWVECSPTVRKTWFQSQVASYQKLLKWYLILPYLTLSRIRYV